MGTAYSHAVLPWVNIRGRLQERCPLPLFHRQRLVELAKHNDIMDLRFTQYCQCQDANVCEKMEQEYGRAAYVPSMENFNYKYLILVDGNSFVSRAPKFLSSGSLIFRSGIFSEWFEDRLVPHKHYIPVKLDYSDLEEKVQWAITHDDEAGSDSRSWTGSWPIPPKGCGYRVLHV